MKRLKSGIETDREKLEEKIEDLRKLNNELAEKAFGMPAEDGGAGNGSAVHTEEREGV